jgi:hypothetical protein
MTTRNKIIFLSISFSIIFLLIFIFLILPTVREIRRISKEIFQTKLKFEETIRRQEEIERFKKISKEIKDNFLKFNSSFVNKEIPIDFVEFLEKTARYLEIQSQISILGSSKENLSFQISGVGFTENVFRFIEKIENSNYFIQLERIKLSKLEESELKVEELKKFSKNGLKFEISFSVLTK